MGWSQSPPLRGVTRAFTRSSVDAGTSSPSAVIIPGPGPVSAASASDVGAWEARFASLRPEGCDWNASHALFFKAAIRDDDPFRGFANCDGVCRSVRDFDVPDANRLLHLDPDIRDLPLCHGRQDVFRRLKTLGLFLFCSGGPRGLRTRLGAARSHLGHHLVRPEGACRRRPFPWPGSEGRVPHTSSWPLESGHRQGTDSTLIDGEDSTIADRGCRKGPPDLCDGRDVTVRSDH